MTHAYNVSPIATSSRMKYQAMCECGQWFQLHDELEAAGLDGLDHVRTMSGRKTRRAEIVEELAAKKELQATKRRAGR